MTSSDSETRARTTDSLSTTQGGSIDVRQGAPALRSNQTLSARSETGNRRAPAPTPMWESPLTVAIDDGWEIIREYEHELHCHPIQAVHS